MFFSKIVEEDIKDIIEGCTLNLLLDKFSNKTVLITGATGMIGSYFIYTLLELNKKNKANIKIKALIKDEKKWNVEGDLLTEVIIQDVTQDIKVEGEIDYIIHAASPASPIIMKEKPVETIFANTIGTANLLKLAKEKKVEGFLFISSREIYGEPVLAQEKFTEDGLLGQVDPLVPRNSYAEGKKAGESMCVAFNQQYGINTKIVRLAHTYGPGMSIYDGRVQADFLRNVLNNEDIVLKSDGQVVRTYTYVADAIIAMLQILLKSKDIVYNVASENCTTTIKGLAEMLTIINKNCKLKFNITKKANNGWAAFNKGILSTQKIYEELGWKPRFGIKEGFIRTIEHTKILYGGQLENMD